MECVFGYGSLINLKSAERTLGRTIDEKDVSLVEIRDYTRMWGVVGNVIVHNNAGVRFVNAVFLDIQKKPNEFVNGILIPVSSTELGLLDERERFYRRVNVSHEIYPKQEEKTVFAYVGRSELFVRNYHDPVILKKYQNIVSEGVTHWGEGFAHRFQTTARPHTFRVIDGSYEFLDYRQNILTGHMERP